MQQHFDRHDAGVEFINGSISGSITDDGLARLGRLEKHRPTILIIELGATMHCAVCRWKARTRICAR
ncbi:MAG: hypothetical protein R3E83_22735 [Burkholderiaceae bacterium]